MNSVQIADETFVCADPTDVGRAVADVPSWRRWWPDLQLTSVEDRGPAGQRWTVAGKLTGTMEVWLQPMMDGVILHYFLHAEPAGDPGQLDLAKLNHQRRVAGKKMAFEVKTRMEAQRPVGVSRLA